MSNTVQMDFRFQPDHRCSTVHVIGSWDGYAKQLPLAKDGKSGYWKGAFRFSDKTLENGGRCWYYYLLDGYKTAHNHEKPFVREPTTGRILNILDMPSKRPPTSSTRTLPVRGRPLSPDRIAAPRPSRPQQAYNHLTKPSQARDMAVQELSRRLLHERIDSSDESVFESDSDVSDRRSDPSSHTSSSSDDSDSEFDLRADSPPGLTRDVSPPTSVGSSEDGSYIDMSHGYPVKVSPVGYCTCQRWGITRSGHRIKLECEGDLCDFSYKEVQCSAALRQGREGSVSSSDDGRDYKVKPKIETRGPSKSSSSKSSSDRYKESSSSSKYKESSSSKYKESSSSRHEARSSRRR